MSDLISRQAAIKAIEELPNAYNGFSDSYDKSYIIGTLEEVPSVQPEHGKWLHGREVSRDYIGDALVAIHYEKWWCSECNYSVDDRPLWKFCPNCGARNEVEE